MSKRNKTRDEAAQSKKWLEDVYGEELIKRVENILKKARRYGITISTAESLTAGALSQLIAAVDWLGGNKSDDMGVLIAGDTVYSDLAKHELLRVDQHTLAEHTAVSAAVAREMAEGIIKKTGTTISISLTGYAGLSHRDGKPHSSMGTVFVGAAYQGIAADAPDISSAAVEVKMPPIHRSLGVHGSVIAGVCALEATLEAFSKQEPINIKKLDSEIKSAHDKNAWLEAHKEAHDHTPPKANLPRPKDPQLEIKRERWRHAAVNREMRRFKDDAYKPLPEEREDPLLRALIGIERVQRFDHILYEITQMESKRTARPLITFSGDETIGLMGPLLTMQEGVTRILESGVIDARNIFSAINEIAEKVPGAAPGVTNSAKESAIQDLRSSNLSKTMQTSVSHIAMSAWRISPDKAMPTGEPSVINIAFAVKDPDGTIRLISGDIEIRNRAGHYEASLATADAMLALLEQEFIPQGHIAADRNLRRHHSEAMAKIRNLHTEIL